MFANLVEPDYVVVEPEPYSYTPRSSNQLILQLQSFHVFYSQNVQNIVFMKGDTVFTDVARGTTMDLVQELWDSRFFFALT